MQLEATSLLRGMTKQSVPLRDCFAAFAMTVLSMGYAA